MQSPPNSPSSDSSSFSVQPRFEEHDDDLEELRLHNETLQRYVDYHYLQSYSRVASKIHGSVVAAQTKRIEALQTTVQQLLSIVCDMSLLLEKLVKMVR
jgi:hypothetical protein